MLENFGHSCRQNWHQATWLIWYSIDFRLLLIVTSAEVLQASVYGIGVCAEFGGAAFKPLVGGGQLNFKALYISIVKLS